MSWATSHRRRTTWMRAAVVGTVLALAACVRIGDASRPIPTALRSASATPRVLVVVLPGRGDDLESLARRGIDRRIAAAWPTADVLLTGATLAYYREGRLEARLHDEVVAPARARRRYDAVWLVGISLGAVGAIMYEQQHADTVDGLVLLGPFLGDRALLREIEQAGGPGAWQPGPHPARVGEDNFQRELWRALQDLRATPRRAARVQMVYGERDRFRGALAPMQEILPAENILLVPGGHDWHAWNAGLDAVLSRTAPTR